MRVEHLSDFEIQSLLDDSFDGDRAETEKHIEGCSHCTALTKEYKAIWHELSIDYLPEADINFSNRVLGRLQPLMSSEPKYPAELVIGLALAFLAASIVTHIYLGWEWISALTSSGASLASLLGRSGNSTLSWASDHSNVLGATGISILTISFYGLLDGILRRQKIHRLR